MDNMKKYFQKLRRFLRVRRRTRKKAALQNSLITILLIVLCMVSLKLYAEENTMEAAVNRYCSSHLIDNAEICSVVTYEGAVLHPGQLCKDVVIRKHINDNEYYQCTVWAVKENPWKWEITGSFYNNEPLTYEFDAGMVERIDDNSYDISAAGIPGISFGELYGLHTENSIYGEGESGEKIIVRFSDDGSRIDVSVEFMWENDRPYQGFNTPPQQFYVDLKTGECSRNFADITVRESFSDPEIVTKNLWISDEHLIRAARIIAEAIETMESASGQE